MSQNPNRPTSAMPVSASASGPSGDGPRRSKPIPPHGLRHWVLARRPDCWLTPDEAKRLIRYFGADYVEAVLGRTKGGPR